MSGGEKRVRCLGRVRTRVSDQLSRPRGVGGRLHRVRECASQGHGDRRGDGTAADKQRLVEQRDGQGVERSSLLQGEEKQQC